MGASNSIARNPVLARCAAIFASGIAVAALLGGCALLDKPRRPVPYDFGAASAARVPPRAGSAQPLPPVVLADIETSSAFDGSAILYRLAYADERELRPYALARWSAPPAQLVRQRLREVIGQERAVLTVDQSAVLERSAGVVVRVVRIELEEFTHLFTDARQSVGVVRLRATAFDSLSSGELLVAQRAFTARVPADTADAPGGVKALVAATDAIAQEMTEWLRQTR